MKSKILFIPLLTLALVGCESHVNNNPPPPPPPPTQQSANPSNMNFQSRSYQSDSNPMGTMSMANDQTTDQTMNSMGRAATSTTSPYDAVSSASSDARNAASAYQNEADNTGRNIRDRNTGSLTAFDQSENSNDRTISQVIRRALMNDPTLSTNAKNIKVITIDRIVTLRGPVNSAQEKALIERLISQISGIERLDNQLEVLQQQQPSSY